MFNRHEISPLVRHASLPLVASARSSQIRSPAGVGSAFVVLVAPGVVLEAGAATARSARRSAVPDALARIAPALAGPVNVSRGERVTATARVVTYGRRDRHCGGHGRWCVAPYAGAFTAAEFRVIAELRFVRRGR
jgi:hypothetical protein